MTSHTDARLDLISFANGIRNDADTSPPDANHMTVLITDLCEKREQPITESLTSRKVTILRRYDAEYYDELAERHRLPMG